MENLEKTTGVEKISLYAVVILVSLFVCEFAFAARKAKGVTCVKDFIITYNYRVVPYIAIPVIMVLLISYFRRMYDDNRMVRYVNIRNFYISVIGGGIGRIVLYVVIMTVWMFIGGVVSTHGIIDNWQSKMRWQREFMEHILQTQSLLQCFQEFS